ncbi:hypothetical protein EJB05_02310, partial [Eragrostis curvula]
MGRGRGEEKYFQLAYSSMEVEPASVWVPCDFQLANWSTEPVVYAPGLSVEYGYTDKYSSCIQTSALVSNGQIVEYADHPVESPVQDCKVVCVFEGAVKDVADDAEMRDEKIHRYPEIIVRARGLRERCTIPLVVAIGPYHHGLDHLKKAEKMKHAAAWHCVKDPDHLQQMYDAVVDAAQGARGLYDNDKVAGMSDDDFLPMMFYDACFLVQYMSLVCATTKAEVSPQMPLFDFINSNRNEIFHDIMLLENQLPWPVVHTVLELLSKQPTLQKYIDKRRGCLQDRKGKDSGRDKCIPWDDAYKPPHLLALLRYYIVGGHKHTRRQDHESRESLSLSVGATELAEMGIKLKPNRTTEVFHMKIKPRWIRFAHLCLAPLSLDDMRASYLVNMAALELSTTPNFQDADDERSAVCSYLRLLAMLVDKEEDVHLLRRKHILQGGAGLTDKEVLDFFTTYRGLRLGSCYMSTMKDIQHYKSTKWIDIKVYAFFYKYWTRILAIAGIIGAFVGFLEKLKSITRS